MRTWGCWYPFCIITNIFCAHSVVPIIIGVHKSVFSFVLAIHATLPMENPLKLSWLVMMLELQTVHTTLFLCSLFLLCSLCYTGVQNGWKLTYCRCSYELSSNTTFMFPLPSSMCGDCSASIWIVMFDCCLSVSVCFISTADLWCTHIGNSFQGLLTWCSLLMFRYVMSLERRHCNLQVSHKFSFFK